MLSVESLHSGYTGIDVLKGVSLAVADNAIIGVLGPNGAGKTALLRAISGLNPVRGGRISFAGTDISRASPDAVVRHGVIQVPQGRMLFGSMTVRENLELGAYLQTDGRAIEQRLLLVHELFPVLRERSGLEAAYLSGGEQQMLALGRALMGNPRLLLLDEPSLGLAPKVFDTILERGAADGPSLLCAGKRGGRLRRTGVRARARPTHREDLSWSGTLKHEDDRHPFPLGNQARIHAAHR
jgi:branched-chain amino acid transport system ATP-binding protein